VSHTEITHQVFVFICTFAAEQGFSPSVREIAGHCYLSTTAVVRHLDRLEAWAWIQRQAGQPRSIKILKQCENG
jgi:DNA-binding MarR family transcriptional regulator